MRFYSYCIVLMSLGFVGYTVCIQKPLTVLYVVDCFPKLSETFILHQITGLLDAGHTVYIYAKTKGKGLMHSAYYDYDLSDRVMYFLALSRVKTLFFTSKSFDVVVCHFGNNGYKAYQLIKEYKLEAPLVIVFHGKDMSTMLDKNPYMYDQLFACVDLALPISECWRNKLIHLGYDSEKMSVHYMGVDCDMFEYQTREYNPEHPIRFISIARLVEKKGITYGLQAFAQLAHEYDNLEYVIIGDGPLKKSLVKLARNLGIENKVLFLGNCTQESMKEICKTAHIFLAPSITASDGDAEGIPVSIMEAMAMGLPVLSTFHSGIPELVIDGTTGFLVQEKDVKALYEKMHYLIQRPDVWSLIGRAGRARVVAEFNQKKQNERLIEILYSLVNKKERS